MHKSWLLALFLVPPLLICYFPFFAWNLAYYFYTEPRTKSLIPGIGKEPIYENAGNNLLFLALLFFLFFLFKVIYQKTFSWRGWLASMALPILMYIGAFVWVFSPNFMSLGLYLSIMHNDSTRYERLVSFGADPNRVLSIEGKNEKYYSPLMVAVLSEKSEFVKKFLKDGANVNAKDVEGRTALEIAKEKKYDLIVELLSQSR